MYAESEPRSLMKAQGEKGFALGLVVLLLFAIGALGAAGYQVVRTEVTLAAYSTESVQALTVARSGLQWFTGQQRGLMLDSAEYSINGGTATITARKVATLSPEEDLYFVSSRGRFTDPRRPRMPAVRMVSQYAVFKNLPVKSLASLVTSAGRIRVRESAVVDGNDHASPGQCFGAPVAPWAGVVARSSVQARGGGTILGDPAAITHGSFEKVVEAVGLPWDVLVDSSFPVEYDGSWPDFSSLGIDEFPVIRVEGDFVAQAAQSGQGTLIVTGRLLIPNNSNWQWRGIVLAGDLGDVGPESPFTLEGVMVVGQGSAMGSLDMDAGVIRFHSCYVASAGAALAHLTAVSGGWWETL